MKAELEKQVEEKTRELLKLVQTASTTTQKEILLARINFILFEWFVKHKTQVGEFKKESLDRALLGIFHLRNVALRSLLTQQLVDKKYTMEEVEEMVNKGIDYENQFEKWKELCEELIKIDENGTFYLK